MPASSRALVCAVSVPVEGVFLDELIGEHGGELHAHAPGWWRASFQELEAAKAFVAQARQVCDGLAAAIHVGAPDAAATAYLGRLARGAPQGALWLTGAEVDREAFREVPLHPAFDIVVPLEEGALRRPPTVVTSARAEDRRSLAALHEMGVRVVVFEGSQGVGKSRLLREHVLAEGGRVIDGAGYDDPWSFLFVLGRYFGVPIEEQRGLEQGIERIVAGCAAADLPLLGFDHVSEALLPVLRPLVARGGVRAIVVGVDRLGVRGEVSYEVGAPTNSVVEASPGAALAEAVGRHPLASRVLAAGARDASSALVWLERVNGGGAQVRVVLAGLAQLAPAEAFAIIEAAAPMPRLLPLDGLLAASQLQPEAFERGLQWLVESGLVERRREKVWTSSWLAELPLTPERRDELVRTWARWARERLAPVLDHRGEGSLQVLALLDAERALLDRLITGLLDVVRVGADDLAGLAVLLGARSLHAQAVGPAQPLAQPLERALTAVGRSFDVGPDVAISLLLTRARVGTLLGSWTLALADLERAEGLARRLNREEDLDRILVQRGYTQLARGRFDEAEAALMGFRGVAQLEARVQTALGAALTAQGRFEEAGEALEQAEKVRDSLLLVEQGTLAASRALWFRRNERVEEALAEYRRALQVWRRLGKLGREVITRFRLGTTLQGIGDLQGALQEFEAAESVARRAADAGRLALILVQKGLVVLELGEADRARELFLQGLSAARSGRDRGAEGTAIGFLALLRQLGGQLEEARENFRVALRNLEISRERRFGALFHACLAVAEVRLGNLNEGRILVDVARLQLPDADQGMAPALSMIETLVGMMQPQEQEGQDAARAELEVMLREPEEKVENVYVRFVRRYIDGMLKDA